MIDIEKRGYISEKQEESNATTVSKSDIKVEITVQRNKLTEQKEYEDSSGAAESWELIGY